jgi:hypothetical protein
MQKILFQKKISYLFEEFKKAEICDEKGLVELFSENGIYSNTRKKTVIDKWLNGDMKQPPKNILFSFNQYPISYEYKLPNGKNAFSKESFLSSSFSFDSFKQEVDEYIAYKNRPISLLEYNYIYYYYRKKKKIVYAKLETEEKINQNKYVIKIIPPLSSTGKKIPPYKGILEINNERYYISVKNDVEILTLYFVLGRGYADNSKVYGIGLGISHKKGLVEATKELLSKRKLTKEEEDELYLSLNESEYLIADEIEYTDSIKKEYLKKINTKLNNLTTFISTSKESLTLQNKVNTDPYLNIFFRNLIDTNEISKKIILEQYFFTVRRRTALKAFLKSISNIEKNTSKMVYPVFEEDSVLFDKEDEVSVKLLNTISSLAKNGLDLTIIFVVDEKFTVKPNFQKETKKLIDNGVKIKIVFLEDIQKLRLSSHDFLYSKKDELVAIYTSVRDRIRIYKVTTMRGRIKNLIDDFKKIEQKSFLFDDFVEKKKLTHDLVLGQLVGTWNFYFYSSIKKENRHKIWQNRIEIYGDKRVKYLWNNELILQGFIDTTFNQEKAIIYLNHLKKGSLSIITFKKNKIYKNIFKVIITDSQAIDDNYDMASLGIFSKTEQNEQLIRDTLGQDINKVMLCEDSSLERGITKIYTESKF